MADTTQYGPPSPAGNNQQIAPQDLLSQFILGIPRASSPLLPSDDSLERMGQGTGQPGSTAMSSPSAPVAPVPSAPAAPPTDDAVAAARKGVDATQQRISGALNSIENTENQIAANKPVDPTQYRPSWKDRLLGIGVGAMAGMVNPENAAPTANNVAWRGYNRAVAARQRALEPLFTQLNQEKDINLPLYKEQSAEDWKNYEAARNDRTDQRLQEATDARAQYEKDITDVRQQIADNNRQNAVDRINELQKRLDERTQNDKDKLDMQRQLLDLKEQALNLKADQTGKTKPNVIENEKALAIQKARDTYARNAKTFQDDPKGAKEAKEQFVQALRDAQSSYEAKVAENGGTPEHWDVDDNGNFTKAQGGGAPAPAPAPVPAAAPAPAPAPTKNRMTDEVKTAPKSQASGPPASLWKNKESKILTLKGPDGKTAKWQLVNGVPKQL